VDQTDDGAGAYLSLGDHLRQVLSEVDAKSMADQLATNLDAVATIQNKVEWVEAFVVSVYTVELAHRGFLLFSWGCLA
jgi:hypothetical protein